MTGFGAPPPQPMLRDCFRHPGRPTALSCVRCGRPACPECLREAAVGHQCVECVSAGQPVVTPTDGLRRTPFVVHTLIGLNVAFYAITALAANSLMNNDQSRLFYDFVLIPELVADGDWLRVFSSAFMHFGPLHLAANMFALWIAGRELEAMLGRTRFIGLYLASLLGGALAVLALQPPGIATAGASGAIFGLFGAQAIILLQLRRSPAPIMWVIGINFAITLMVPGISLWGHLGGLIAGVVATLAMTVAPALLVQSRDSPGLAQARQVGMISLWAVVALTGMLILAWIGSH